MHDGKYPYGFLINFVDHAVMLMRNQFTSAGNAPDSTKLWVVSKPTDGLAKQFVHLIAASGLLCGYSAPGSK
jgi:glyoxylate utilization-related uncharacterized protein